MPEPDLIHKSCPGGMGDTFDGPCLSAEESMEVKVKTDLWRDLIAHIDTHAYSQAGLGEILGIHQPDVSNLLKGKISRFSIGKFIQFAARLNLGVRVELKAPKRGRQILPHLSAAAGKKERESMRA